jgi:hypothetical protein
MPKMSSKLVEARREAWSRPFLMLLEGSHPVDTLTSDFQLSYHKNKFLLFKSPNSWYFVIASLKN